MMLGDRLRPLLREPLVHFLLIGLVLFLLMSGREGQVDPASRSITVTQEQINGFAANWEQTWQRPPTADELEGLIDNYVREEIYYREALRLGLDQDDTVIRRRLRTKMEFLARSQAENVTPDDAVLQEWLDRNPARYSPGAATSFDQVYLGSTGDGAGLLAQLRAGADPESLGESLSLPRALDDVDRSEIERQFGQEFAASLAEISVGDWQGPVTSGFGQHLVRVRSRETGEVPSLADVRQQVENDWRAATIEQREAEAFQILRDAYSVEIERVR